MITADLPSWLWPARERLAQAAQHNDAPLLLHGALMQGLFKVAQHWVWASLCEKPVQGHACLRCSACLMLQAGHHPDLQWLLPQAKAQEMGLIVELKTGSKPSQEIRIDEVRDLQDFIHTASSRGKSRWVVLYPFDALNTNAANALLKILEEPSEGLKFILIGHKPEHVLPTIRSRCQQIGIAAPPVENTLAWLNEQGIQSPEVALSLAMNNPFEAQRLTADELQLRKQWIDWLCSPEPNLLIPQGLEKNGLPVLIELAQRLCSDLVCVHQGLPPQWFSWMAPKMMWARHLSMQAFSQIFERLSQEASCAFHPLNPRLALEFIAGEWHNQMVKSLERA